MKPRLLVLLAVLVLAGWLFGPMLIGGRLPAFRDTADYYYPLFQFERDEWRAGRVPLWNPYSNLGMPLAATGTASVFYPAKLIFHLPLQYDWAFRLYLLGHLLLAAGTAYRLARYAGTSVEGAAVAAISYAFGGNVLFQYCNVVFLVGAAWLPAALEAALRMFHDRSLRSRIIFAAVLALMVLGGDPQTAYHAGLLALFAAPISLRSSSFATSLLTSVRLLAIAALFALALSAVQILPSAEMTARSDRVATWRARSLYEIPTALRRDDPTQRIADGLLCRFEEGTHHERAYRYSVAPWRLAEYIWPNLSGRQFPVHRRWLDAIGAEDQIWVPSFYMGLLPMVLALGAIRFRRSDRLTMFLSWSALLAVLASLGRYGPVGQPVGGLYWLMTLVLPGYIEFRYPAKLLVLAALGLSVLAGLGWDRAAGSRRSRLLLLALAGLSMLAAGGALLTGPWWAQCLCCAEADPLFGPFDAHGAWLDLLCSLLQTAVAAVAAWWLLGRRAAGRRWAGAAAVVLLALDLAVANRWLIATAPADAWHVQNSPLPLRTRGGAAQNSPLPLRERGGGEGFIRAFRHDTWLPEAWSSTSSPNRLEELIRWNRRTAAPHHHLAQGLGLLEVSTTMNLFDYDLLCSTAGPAALDAQKGSGLLDALGAETLISPDSSQTDDVAFNPNPGRLPRAWIVHDVLCLPPLESTDPAAVARRSVEVLRADDRPRDFRRQAAVETALSIDAPHGPAVAAADDRDACRIVRHRPDRVEIEAQLGRPGLVVSSDQFYPGWQLTVATDGEVPRPAHILRTNRVMRGVWLPAGHHRLVYLYRPGTFMLGAAITALGLVAAIFLLWRRQSWHRPDQAEHHDRPAARLFP